MKIFELGLAQFLALTQGLDAAGPGRLQELRSALAVAEATWQAPVPGEAKRLPADLLTHVVVWAQRVAHADQAGDTAARLLATLSLGLVAGELELRQVETQAQATVPSPEALERRAEALDRLMGGRDFDLENLFLGAVPTLAEQPACGSPGCRACEARREYHAARRPH